MWTQGLSNGQQAQLLFTTVALAIIDRGRRRPRMRYYRFLVFLVVMQFLIGATLTAVSVYSSTVSPSLRMRDLPHWAGIPLFLSGLLGLAYVTRCYGDLRISPVSDVFKALSLSLAAVTVILCTCAVTFLYLHLATFAQFEDCKNVAHSSARRPPPPPLLSFGNLIDGDPASEDDASSASAPSSLAEVSEPVSCTCYRDAGAGLRRRYLYESIACDDVLALIKFLFIVMDILGCLGAVDCAAYVVSLWVLRYKDIYVGTKSGIDVESTPNRPTSSVGGGGS